jgi:hypothetical protein
MPAINWTAAATIILAIATAFNGWSLYVSRPQSKKPQARPKTKSSAGLESRIGGWGFRNRYFIVALCIPPAIIRIIQFLSLKEATPRQIWILLVILFLIAGQVVILALAGLGKSLQRQIDDLKKQTGKQKSDV